MRKIFLFIAIVSFALLAGSLPAMAEEVAKEEKSVEAIKAVDVGNKICPVSGEKIDEKMKSIYEYEGKIYNFCCSMCIEDFKKDPQKYIQKVEEELKSPPKEEAGQTEATGGVHEEHSHHH